MQDNAAVFVISKFGCLSMGRFPDAYLAGLVPRSHITDQPVVIENAHLLQALAFDLDGIDDREWRNVFEFADLANGVESVFAPIAGNGCAAVHGTTDRNNLCFHFLYQDRRVWNDLLFN